MFNVYLAYNSYGEMVGFSVKKTLILYAKLVK